MRPSKRYFHRHFREDVANSAGKKCAADISCAKFKNYKFFKSEKYLGIDIRSEVLEYIPKKTDGMPEILTEITDITQLDIKEKYVIDFIVSTHTLSHLEPKLRFSVIENFIDHLEQGGDLLFNVQREGVNEDALDDLLKKSFSKVKKVTYRNKWNQNYEKTSLNESTGHFVSANSVLSNFKERFLYLTEKLSILSSTGNMLYYYCQHKK